MTVKYLVLSAGAYRGINFVGSLSHLFKEHFINRNEIKEIYSVSVGAIIGLMILLKNDWGEIVDFFVNRPWEKTLNKLLPQSVLTNLYKDKGVIDNNFIKTIIENVLKSNGLNIDITLKELYEYSNVVIHIYSTRLNDFKLVDFNHITYPDVKLIDAISMSSCLPIIFKPHYFENSYHIDGGFNNFYPVKMCIENIGQENKDEILSIVINDNKTVINETDGLFSYLFDIFTKIKDKCDEGTSSYGLIKNEIIIESKQLNMESLLNMINKKEYRQQEFDYGVECAKKFIENLQNSM